MNKSCSASGVAMFLEMFLQIGTENNKARIMPYISHPENTFDNTDQFCENAGNSVHPSIRVRMWYIRPSII